MNRNLPDRMNPMQAIWRKAPTQAARRPIGELPGQDEPGEEAGFRGQQPGDPTAQGELAQAQLQQCGRQGRTQHEAEAGGKGRSRGGGTALPQG